MKRTKKSSLDPLYIRRDNDSDKANRYRNILAAIKNLQRQLEDEKPGAFSFVVGLGEREYSQRLKDERRKRNSRR